MALVVAAVFFLPGLAISLILVPCAPVCLCPLFCSPRTSLPKRCVYPTGVACGAALGLLVYQFYDGLFGALTSVTGPPSGM